MSKQKNSRKDSALVKQLNNKDFIMHNDTRTFTTHYQCSNCKSFNTQSDIITVANDLAKYQRLMCNDCLYSHLRRTYKH